MAKKKVNKSEQRKENKKRVLYRGEFQRDDGLYMYSYTDPITKKRNCVYSWKLEKHDPLPAGKRPCKSLREKIAELQVKNYVGISLNGGGMTVSQLVDKYIEGVMHSAKPTTRAGYKTVQNFLKTDPIGNRRIDSINAMQAEEWLKGLKAAGKSYSSIQSIRGVLRPAFKKAVKADLLFRNPFDFPLGDALVNDSVKRKALSRKNERRFLEFIQNDEHFNQYYDAIFILFKTGLRIGELCGLTLADVNMIEKKININHQIQYNAELGKYVSDVKTDAGERVLPMTPEVYEAFNRVIKSRKIPTKETILFYKDEETGKVYEYTGFLFLNREGTPTVGYYWEKKFQQAVEKFNKIYKDELPTITPHVCRHTFCTRMATSGISVSTLKYIMGHEDIQTTLNVYTHADEDDAKDEIERVEAKRKTELALAWREIELIYGGGNINSAESAGNVIPFRKQA